MSPRPVSEQLIGRGFFLLFSFLFSRADARDTMAAGGRAVVIGERNGHGKRGLRDTRAARRMAHMQREREVRDDEYIYAMEG